MHQLLAGLLLLPPAAPAPTPIAGGVYYRFGDDVVVTRYLPGSSATTHAGSMSQFSASPDGKKVAWVDDKGRLHVGFGSADKIVATGALFGVPCATPTWSPDSMRIAFVTTGTEATAPIVVVGADGKGRKRIGRTYGACHLTWSGNGRYLAGYAGTTEGVYLLDVLTGKSRKAKGVKLSNHVQSLSPDGRKLIYFALSPRSPAGDGVWPRWWKPTITDTVTGVKTAIPVKGRLIGALYLRDGRLVVRVKGATRNTLVVLSPSLKVLQKVAEPAKARTSGLLQAL